MLSDPWQLFKVGRYSLDDVGECLLKVNRGSSESGSGCSTITLIIQYLPFLHLPFPFQGKLLGAVLMLTDTHLYNIRCIPDKEGHGFIKFRHPYASIAKITGIRQPYNIPNSSLFIVMYYSCFYLIYRYKIKIFPIANSHSLQLRRNIQIWFVSSLYEGTKTCRLWDL